MKGCKQILTRIEDIIENVINMAYPDRDIYRVLDGVKKRYMEVIQLAIQFYCKLETDYYDIDDDQRIELSNYTIQKGI